MKIKTKFIGDLEIKAEDIFHLPLGMPGFEDEHEFVLLPLSEDTPFMMFQSVKNENLCFILAYPFLVNQTYEFDLSDEDRELLDVTKPEDVLCYCIVSLKEPFSESTINLKAPIIINVQTKKGKQVVLHNHDYMIRYPIQSLTKGEE